MKLTILGCSGGIGGKHLRTTSLLLDHDILIDAGTGVMDLTVDELSVIDHVFITHTHLDHIASLPLMLDSVAERRQKPLMVYASPAAISILRNHIFNGAIWPDFSKIPTPEAPFLSFQPIEILASVNLNGRLITPLPVDHTVPSVGYRLDSGKTSLVFSGDTGISDAFWQAINRIPNLGYLIIECAFSNREEKLALISKHLCPSMLEQELLKLEQACEIFITHLKPGQVELTMQEIVTTLSKYNPRMLQNNQVFEF